MRTRFGATWVFGKDGAEAQLKPAIVTLALQWKYSIGATLSGSLCPREPPQRPPVQG